MHRTALPAIVSLLFAVTATPLAAEEPLKQLDAGQINALIVGKAVTDDAHWSDHFYRDGSMKSIELGETKRGSWKLQDKSLCMTRPIGRGRAETECNEIWKSGDRIVYRRDGVTISEGALRSQW